MKKRVIERNMFFGAKKDIFLKAIDLRNNMTESEKVLWNVLHDRKIFSMKFRRQHPIDIYIADFYCHDLNLIIELDGKIHNKQKEYDSIRDNKLSEKGLRVLRIENDMLDEISDVKEKIEIEIKNILAEKVL